MLNLEVLKSGRIKEAYLSGTDTTFTVSIEKDSMLRKGTLLALFKVGEEVQTVPNIKAGNIYDLPASCIGRDFYINIVNDYPGGMSDTDWTFVRVLGAAVTEEELKRVVEGIFATNPPTALTPEQEEKLNTIKRDGSGKTVLFDNGKYENFEDNVKNIVEGLGGTGEKGEDGKSAYQIWLDAGNSGTEEEFLESLQGEPGENGPMGESGSDGSSAYEIWINEGNSGTEQDFLDSLKGEKGADGTMSFEDLTDEQKETLKGENGKSAYQIWLDAGNTGTEHDFLDSLKGEKGDKGEDGKDGEDGSKNIDDTIKSAETTWSSEKIAGVLGSKVYTHPSDLGLDRSTATVDDVRGKLKPGEMFIANTEHFDKCKEIFPYEVTSDTAARIIIIRAWAPNRDMVRWEKRDGTKIATGVVGTDGSTAYMLGWKFFAMKDDLSSCAKTYTTLDELGLTADATVENVVSALKNGESFLAPVNIFTNYETIFPNKVPNDQWNKIHIIKGTSLPNSHIRCFSQSGACEYLANVNNTNVVSWNDVSGAYIDISDSIIEKLGNEILKYPVGKYRINSTTTGNKFTDLPSNDEIKCGLIEINGTAVGKSPFTDTWVYRMYKFECLTGTSSYVRRLNSGETVGQIELDTGWQKDGHEIYTSLSQLKLKAPVSVGEIFNAMPYKTMAVIACEGKEGNTDGAVVHVSDVPVSYGILTIKKNDKGRFSIEYQNSLQGSPCNVKRWIGTLKGSDGTGLYWKQLSAEPTFVTLNDIGLTADATFQDVIDKLPKGGSALLGVTEFTNYQTIFPYEEGNDQFGRVYIVKGTEDGGRVYARWFRKDGVKEAIAIFNINDNKFGGWRLLKNRQTFTSLTELGLTADATIDDVIGALKDGETALISTNEFTNYKDGMFPNQCTNDQYAVIKVEKESGSKVFLEWRQKEGDAYAIGGLNGSNKFTNWNNLVRFKQDDFGDDSIVTIGDTVSADGAIQTLANLGFSNDIMTWKTGVYKVSHVSGLTNVPSDITATNPIFRLEHHNIKKWTGGHAPCSHTWAGRHSVLYAEGGNVYHRYTESGATAGTYTKDTGWQQIVTNTFNGQAVKSITIDLSASDLQSTGSGSVHLSLGNYIDKSTKAIRAEGYYNPPSDSTYPVVIPVIFGSQAGHLSTDSTGYSFRAVQSPSGKKGSGFVKIYYVE